LESVWFGAIIPGWGRKELEVAGFQSALVRKARLAGAAVLIVALTLSSTLPAVADIRILSSGGGTVGGYLDFFAKVKQSGERVVIDGPCLSACTLVLSTIPRKRICVTSRAVLGFHAPYLVDKNGRTFRKRELTQAMNATYPPNVRAWIKRRGGLSSNLIYLKGNELKALYPRC
jgi:hypothetical protein